MILKPSVFPLENAPNFLRYMGVLFFLLMGGLFPTLFLLTGGLFATFYPYGGSFSLCGTFFGLPIPPPHLQKLLQAPMTLCAFSRHNIDLFNNNI